MGHSLSPSFSVCDALIAVVVTLLFSLAAIGNEQVDGSASSIIVIVNSSVPETKVSRNMLRAIYGMRLHSWSEQLPTRVFVLADRSELHKRFCEQKLDILPHQMQQAWDRLVYSGTGQAPMMLRTEEEMFLRVESTPGAIGYVSKAPAGNAVKILDIISAPPSL
ncbi:MAG: hypothetical protein ACFCVA_03480 [Gammaproteobacteria bacterium]